MINDNIKQQQLLLSININDHQDHQSTIVTTRHCRCLYTILTKYRVCVWCVHILWYYVYIYMYVLCVCVFVCVCIAGTLTKRQPMRSNECRKSLWLMRRWGRERKERGRGGRKERVCAGQEQGWGAGRRRARHAREREKKTYKWLDFYLVV